ncbi:FtsW/RodA/SpoVE family cell cycle protein [Apilactobacillus apisilvae]|uniref:Probable peptidoglycan glycosyltransferase FtsW n=1 Tax=Apilactobacillus apisilvae TaxID=2923364 RepID=A0ABY4PIA1_9LACO|nr:FtsW/RodA/SpoVE family cell cycle protein [Apilactobacillus apisilvae]UQS85519.1 FtsW/RodA/SpoVE family cell cycle protein [Apilactobacillus apisilvae]
MFKFKQHISNLKKSFLTMDYYIFIPYILLSFIGLIMVYSSSSNIAVQNGGTPFEYLFKQSIYLFISLFLIILCLAGNNKFVRNPKFLGLFSVVLFCSLIYLKLFGHSINGAAGWIALGPIHIQPTEVAKVYILLRFTATITKKEPYLEGHWWASMRAQILTTLFLLFLIVIQPDLGGTIINFLILFVLLLSSGINWRGAGLLLGITSVISYLVVKLLAMIFSNGTDNYQIQRIISFTDPFKYSQGIGAQLVNSYYALSNGGVFGVGLGNSIQKTGYLPEPNTDFIMSIVAEELGLIGVLFILFLLLTIIVRCIQLGIRSRNTYDTLICYGVGSYLTIQAFINVGGVSGMLPITGVTFPFISYGGSSMITLSLCIGMILVISSKQKKQRYDF